MTLKEFLNSALQIKESVDSQNDLIKYLESVSSVKDDYLEFFKDLRSKIGNVNAINTTVNELNSFNNNVLNIIKELRPRDIVLHTQTLKLGLEKSNIFGEYLDEFIKHDIENLIDYHTDAYSEKSFNEILSFVHFCPIFLQKLKAYSLTSDVFLKNLELEKQILPENCQLIDIQIKSQSENLDNFSNFLLFLEKLYQDLCKAYEIQYDEHPLSIVKIESGSIWTKLFGHKHLVQLIKDLIFGMAGYFRDWQTGVIEREQIENKVIEANLILDLLTKAKKHGVKNDKKVLLEKTFGQAILNISKAMPKSTTEIVLDEKNLLNLSTKEIKAIEGKTQLLLKKKNEK